MEKRHSAVQPLEGKELFCFWPLPYFGRKMRLLRRKLLFGLYIFESGKYVKHGAMFFLQNAMNVNSEQLLCRTLAYTFCILLQ